RTVILWPQGEPAPGVYRQRLDLGRRSETFWQQALPVCVYRREPLEPPVERIPLALFAVRRQVAQFRMTSGHSRDVHITRVLQLVAGVELSGQHLDEQKIRPMTIRQQAPQRQQFGEWT